MSNPKNYLVTSIMIYFLIASAFLLYEYAAPSYDWSSFLFFSFVYWLILSLDYHRKFKRKVASN
ncbi:hypothetical protein MKX54_10390 [Alkalihalobacillus sp. FSL R5-0424]